MIDSQLLQTLIPEMDQVGPMVGYSHLLSSNTDLRQLVEVTHPTQLLKNGNAALPRLPASAAMANAMHITLFAAATGTHLPASSIGRRGESSREAHQQAPKI